MDTLYQLTPVSLDLKILGGRGCYLVSCSVFGDFGLVSALHLSLITCYYCTTVGEY